MTNTVRQWQDKTGAWSGTIVSVSGVTQANGVVSVSKTAQAANNAGTLIYTEDVSGSNHSVTVTISLAASSNGGGGISGGSVSSSGTAVTTSVKQTGDNVVFTYSDADATAAVGELAAKENLTLDGKGQTGANSITVTNNLLDALDKSNKKDTNDSNNSGVDFVLPGADVTFDSTALSSVVSQAAGKDVSLTVKKLDTATLTAEQQKLVGTSPVYDFSMLAGGAAITQFGGGNVSITLPYTGSGTPASVTIFYLDSTGNLIPVDCTYNPVTHTVSFTVAHFSRYVVANVDFPFADVTTTDWYFKAVKFVQIKGIFSGSDKSHFAPATTMNRAMFVTVLGRMGKTAVDHSQATGFKDVVNDGWSTGYISWATKNGIIGGYGNGMFGQNDAITREQMAVIMYNYAKFAGYDVSNTNTAKLYAFQDGANTDSWAVKAMAWAVNIGIMSGTGNNKLTPTATASRSQVAQIVLNFYDKLGLN